MLQAGERLVHYSEDPITNVFSTRGFQKEKHFKPAGLWVSVEHDDRDDGWRQWCEAESFRVERLSYRTAIHLAKDADILRLTGAGDIKSFHQEYADQAADVRYESYVIDWRPVVEKYKGIIIAPYIWSMRMDLMWYYSWDCASGCIWDHTAIEKLEPMEPMSPIVETIERVE